VEEVDGVFVLPIAGFVCVGRKGPDVIALDEDSGVEAKLPARDEDFAEKLVDRRARVERATVSHESTLRIEFDGGTVLEIPAGDYEAWEVSVADGSIFAVAPAGGGEPAIWDVTSEAGTINPGDPLPPWLVDPLESFGLAPTGSFEFRRTKDGQSFQLRPATNHEEDT
jgi:hypothetical protein